MPTKHQTAANANTPFSYAHALLISARLSLPGAAWELRGEAVVRVMGMRVGVALSKPLRMPPTRIEAMRVSNVAIESGNGTSGVLRVGADASFFSSSPLELLGLGDVEVPSVPGVTLNP